MADPFKSKAEMRKWEELMILKKIPAEKYHARLILTPHHHSLPEHVGDRRTKVNFVKQVKVIK